LPDIMPQILVEEMDKPGVTDTPAEDRPQVLLLDDCPEIRELWNAYLEEKWLPWATETERLRPVQDVYSKLHDAYLQLKRQGEAYEVVLGLGLLTWQTPSGQRIRRHLVTAHACIEFDAERGTLTVGPGAEGADVTLEQDMLKEESEYPPADIRLEIEEDVKNVGDDIWDVSTVQTVLSAWVHALPGAKGSYSESIELPTEVTANPTLTYTPALILRRRSQRSLARVFEEIIAQLEAGVQVPPGIRGTVGMPSDDIAADEEGSSSESTSEAEDVFFPLPTNDEQKRIVEALRRRQGVLVQGPPGTGKSHTITNLICHLLANGKRVLVTSQTPRALQVLKKKIPPEISALCVSLLGNDSASLKDLEQSVHGITNRQVGWDPKQNLRETDRLRSELDALRRQESELNRRLREVRERETCEFRICEGAYVGTAQCIAERIASERSEHEWLHDKVSQDCPPPLSDDEALELLGLHRELNQHAVAEASQSYPDPDGLPGPQDLERLCRDEARVREIWSTFSDVNRSDLYAKLSTATHEDFASLKNSFTGLLEACDSLLKSDEPWVPRAVHDVLSERERSWKALLDSTQQRLNGLMQRGRLAEDCCLQLPASHARSEILADAKALLAHFNNGGKLGLPLFRPKPVKSAWYLVREARLDGRLCDRTEIVANLVIVLQTDDHIEALWSDWAPYASRTTGSRPVQVGTLENLCRCLERILGLHGLLERAKAACRQIEHLPEPTWYVYDELKRYSRTMEAVECGRGLKEATSVLKDAERVLIAAQQESDCHPLVHRLYESVLARNTPEYREAFQEISSLAQVRRKIGRLDVLQSRLETPAPNTARHLEAHADEAWWDETLTHFTISWKWMRARTWLQDYVGSASETDIVSELARVQERIGKTTGELAAALAWAFCLARLKESERQALMAWSKVVKKLGKGTGKRAEVHRRAARDNMEDCRSAIPAWIMPLYRVAETVTPGVDSYDVIIIDEASQSGPDALFLQFLAQKIVVVGDDEQISPENVGILRENADALQHLYLRDLSPAQREALSLDSSFFELAEIMFGGRIPLREHFRCVPEIIQFSNELCYSSSPLIPLRQYAPDRLQPIVVQPVPDGYREGDDRTARNGPEVEALVQKVAECCSDPAYAEKTMGVISLLGEYQARLIERLLRDRIGVEEMERRRLICGNPYAFQGDERDVMFLSMVAAPGETRMRAVVAAHDRRRFNVAASRARDQMWLFHTPTLNDFRNKECLRYRLLDYCLNPRVRPIPCDGIDVTQLRQDAQGTSREKSDPPDPFDSWFEVDVFLQIYDRGFRVIPQFKVAGYHIDLVVEGMRGRLAVECDGDRWHCEPDKRDEDMLRQRVLERCGWRFWRVRGGEFYFDPEAAMQPLWELLSRLKIAPGGRDLVEAEPRSTRMASESEEPESPISKPRALSRGRKRVRRRATTPQGRPGKRRALDFGGKELQTAILAALWKCPNGSCKKDALPKKVCSYLQVITRGAPRAEFEKKLARSLKALIQKRLVKEYKAKNVRVKVLVPSSLFSISSQSV